jgi:hypothetical protein
MEVQHAVAMTSINPMASVVHEPPGLSQTSTRAAYRVDLPYDEDLLVALRNIMLIDTHCVYPQFSGSICQAKLLKRAV